MQKRGTSALGPGGKLIAGGVVALIGLFLVWQIVIPFFFNRNTPDKPQDSVKKPVFSGSVVDSVTGLPVTSASIVSGTTQLAEVDVTGLFTITQQLPQGSINIVAPGYAPLPMPSKTQSAALQLKPNILNGQLVDADTKKPLSQRLVMSTSLGGVITDDEGRFSFTRIKDTDKISVQLIGYEKVDRTVELAKLDSPMLIEVRSTSFSSKIVDSETGKGVPNAYITVVGGGTTAAATGVYATTDREGAFTLKDAPRDNGVQVKVRAPGYKIQTFPVATAIQGIKLLPFKFAGVYVPGIFALKPNYDELFAPYLQLAKQGKINAIVVDIKHDDTGKLLYDSKLPLANELKLVYDEGGFKRSDLIDIPKLLQDARKVGLYVVARMVVYRDPAIAKAKPEWALKNRNTGQPWLDLSKLVWPNPLLPQVGDYAVDVLNEAAGFGFDEIQYDYIRFPTDGKLADVDYGGGLSWSTLGKTENEKMRTEVIERTVKKAYEALRYTDVYFSLDVFGYSLWLADDVGIGQQYNNLVFMADYICPMVYATHFQNGTLNQDKYPGPTGNYPGEIITQSGKISNQIEAKLKPVARYRPWLEDFALAPVKHTPERVKVQIDAATQNGASGWTLWNAAGKYNSGVLPLAQKG